MTVVDTKESMAIVDIIKSNPKPDAHPNFWGIVAAIEQDIVPLVIYVLIYSFVLYIFYLLIYQAQLNRCSRGNTMNS